MRYVIGETVELTFQIHDGPRPSSPLVDPTTLHVVVKKPSGAEVTYEWNGTPEVTKDDTGIFHADVVTDEAGTWHYRWEATGKVTAKEGHFYVEGSAL